MADLTEIQSSLSVKLAGSDPSTGAESFWAQVDSHGTLQSGLYTPAGSAIDLNFGAASATTIRVAALLGNDTGSAAFGAGTTTAQVLRVVLATDQTAIPAAQSGTWNLNNISGTVSLPTGAATGTKQDTGNTSLGSIDTKLTSQATSAKQDTGNTSLSSIDGKLGSLGQKAMSGSAPVVLASDQSSIPAIGGFITASGTGAALNAVIFSQDCAGYNEAYVVIDAPGAVVAGHIIAVTFETSVDNANWQTAPADYENNSTAFGSTIYQNHITIFNTADAGPQNWKVPITGRYLRCRISAYLGGATETVSCTAYIVRSSPRSIIVTDQRDATRSLVGLYMAVPIITTNTDTMMTMSMFDSSGLSTATSYPINPEKRLRITSLTFSYTTIVTTPGSAQFNLRYSSTTSSITTATNSVGTWIVGEPTGIAPVAGKTFSHTVNLPDGLDFRGTIGAGLTTQGGLGISLIGRGAAGAAAAVGYGHCVMTGYTY